MQFVLRFFFFFFPSCFNVLGFSNPKRAYKGPLLTHCVGALRLSLGDKWHMFFLFFFCSPCNFKRSRAFRKLSFACVVRFCATSRWNVLATHQLLLFSSVPQVSELLCNYVHCALSASIGCALPECDLLRSAACWLQEVLQWFSSCQFVAAEVVTSAVLGPSLAVPLRSASMWPRIDRPVNGNASLLRWQKCTIMLDFSAEFDIACVWFWPRVCSGFFWLWIGWKSGKAVIGNEFHWHSVGHLSIVYINNRKSSPCSANAPPS